MGAKQGSLRSGNSQISSCCATAGLGRHFYPSTVESMLKAKKVGLCKVYVSSATIFKPTESLLERTLSLIGLLHVPLYHEPHAADMNDSKEPKAKIFASKQGNF